MKPMYVKKSLLISKFLFGCMLICLLCACATGKNTTFTSDMNVINASSSDVSINQETTWEITQYGPRDINSCFYTIYNPSEGLIVIDWGWTDDVAYV